MVADASDQAARRFIEFFTANIRNPNTRAAYARAVMDFFGWCERYGVGPLLAIQPVHVAAYIEELTRSYAAPTVKQRLASVPERRSVVVINQREDLLGRVNVTHDVVAIRALGDTLGHDTVKNR
jgi:hypothetical protein